MVSALAMRSWGPLMVCWHFKSGVSSSLLLALALSVFLVGCGSNTAPGSSAAGSASAGKGADSTKVDAKAAPNSSRAPRTTPAANEPQVFVDEPQDAVG